MRSARTCMSDDGGVTIPTAPEGGSLDRRRVLGGWLLAVPGTAVLTAALVPLHRGPAPTFEAMLFLALAVSAALVGGRWPAVGASLLGTLSLNFFFTDPVHTLAVDNGLNVLTLGLFLVVSLAVASVVDSAARRRHQATAARAEANTLGMLNRTVLRGEYDVPRLLELVRETFGAESAELVPPDHPVPPGDSVAPATKQSLLVLHGASLGPADQRILAAFAGHVGVLREREELARQTAAARELEAGNRTRTALLAAVSHDLRTPLAGVQAAAETLRLHDERLAPEDRADLLLAIEESTGRLTAIVSDLLDMSRLQTGAVQPVLSDVPLDEVVRAALVGLPDDGRVRPPGRCRWRRPTPACWSGCWPTCSATRCGTPTAPWRSPAAPSGTGCGCASPTTAAGVPPEQRHRMFEPFQRLGDSAPGDGVGLGLAVARGLAEAQGGSLVATETPAAD